MFCHTKLISNEIAFWLTTLNLHMKETYRTHFPQKLFVKTKPQIKYKAHPARAPCHLCGMKQEYFYSDIDEMTVLLRLILSSVKDYFLFLPFVFVMF